MEPERLPYLPINMSASGREGMVHGAFDVDYGGGKYLVPAGWETDFASIPRCLWWLFPPASWWLMAAVMHDHLYMTRA